MGFRRVSYMLAAAGALIALPVEAQNRGTVSGLVRDGVTRRHLTGAQVSVVGTTMMASVDEDGRYTITNVPAGTRVIRVRMIGYRGIDREADVAGGATTTIDFELSPAVIQLEEVVVTGTGVATERRKLGNTVATINSSMVENAPIKNVSEILTAREPGVTALASGGMAGEGTRIRIRGSASLTQLNQPILYIDGVRVNGGGGFAPGVGAGGGGAPSRLDDINPASIERIEVLKGAAAATLYGTEASSGVIQIFTKAGTSGGTRYEASLEQSASRFKSDSYAPNAGFARTQAEATRLSNHWGITGLQPFQVFEVPLVKELYETGLGTTASLSVTGGGAGVQYFVSGRFAHENGPFGGTFWGPAEDKDITRQANANLTFVPIDRLRVRVNTAYIERDHSTPQNNNNIYGTISSAIMAKPERANCDLSSRDTSSKIPGACTGAGNAWGAPAFITTREAMGRTVEDEIQRFTGTVGAGYNLKGINLDATFGVDLVNQRGFDLIPFGWNVDQFTGFNTQGRRILGDGNTHNITGDFKATWDLSFKKDWTFQTVVGGQGYFQNTKSSVGTGEQFPAPGVEVVGAGAVLTASEAFLSTAQIGLFGQEQIGFKNYAFLTVGGRYDKHSAFGETAGGVFYPKISVSVVPSDVLNWQSNTFSSFRVRGAVGRSGRQPGAFDKFTTFLAQAAETGPGLAPGNLGNPDLKPEVSTEWEGGLELGLFQDRVALEATYWDRTVKDVLVSRLFAPSGGFRRRQLDNIGKMDAWGVDLRANGLVHNARNLTVNLFASAAFLREKVIDLGGAPPLKSGDTYTRYRNYIKEGYAPGSFFGPKLLEVARPLDQNNDCQPDTEAQLLSYFAVPRSPDVVQILVQGGDPRAICASGDFLGHYLGKPMPDWSGTFGGDLTLWGNLRLTSLFEFRAGDYFVHDLTSAFRRANPSIGRNIKRAAELESIMLNPASTAQQRLDAATEFAKQFKALSPYDGLNEIHQADFIRWRELSLTWSLPNHVAGWFGARGASLTLAGRNLKLWTKYPGADPELNAIGVASTGGVDNNFLDGTNAFGVPIPYRFSLSARVSF